MHKGPLGEGLAADIRAAGGLVTAADLAAARPQVAPAGTLGHFSGVFVFFFRAAPAVNLGPFLKVFRVFSSELRWQELWNPARIEQ